MTNKLRFLTIILILTLPATALASVEEAVLEMRARNFVRAIELLTPEAESGHAFAQEALGDLYAGGLGTAKDMKQACAWWERASLQGRGKAMYNLGLCYAMGQGGLKISNEKAIQYYEMAAQKGIVQGWCAIGELHMTEGSDLFDPEKGKELCLKAADLGSAQAQYTIGGLYLTGSYVDRDFTEAARWMQRASDQGYSKAQYDLALMYRDGLGVERDIPTAGRWFEIAAQHGHTLAQFNLGELLFTTAIDMENKTFNAPKFVSAYYWLLIADKRIRSPKYRERLKLMLSDLENSLPDEMKQNVLKAMEKELGPEFSYLKPE